MHSRLAALFLSIGLTIGLTIGLAGAAMAQPRPTPAPLPLAKDLHEEVRRFAVTVTDRHGLTQTRQIPVTLYRPAGSGPFPLAIVSHGRSPAAQRGEPERQRFEPLSRYLVSKGFAVAVPTRVGYGETAGDFDPEGVGQCQAVQPEAMAAAGSDQVLATLEFARILPWVDSGRWVAIGQSVGGLVTAAVAARNPPGLAAAISFAGGHGGNPQRRPGAPCGPQQLERLWTERAGAARITPLWLYWANDQYWGSEVPQRWATAWAAGGGRLEFHMLAAAGSDGHRGLHIDMDHWVPLVEAHLARAGFTQPGAPLRPPASAYARLDQLAMVPTSQAHRDGHYRAFLGTEPPRAFAVGPTGAVGRAQGDWAIGRALAACSVRSPMPCRLYAVDDDVVWVPPDSDTR
jgi:dienelactone hydrolase